MRRSPYSRQPAQLSASADGGGVLAVRGGGFVTRELIDDMLDQWRAAALPYRLLIDVRDVAGYDRSCGALARQLLDQAQRFGVERIAFVASSAVLRTATRVAASRATVPLRAFEHPSSARQWLERDVTGPISLVSS